MFSAAHIIFYCALSAFHGPRLRSTKHVLWSRKHVLWAAEHVLKSMEQACSSAKHIAFLFYRTTDYRPYKICSTVDTNCSTDNDNARAWKASCDP